MTVLVTGGAGYIGSHTVWALHDRGEDVCVIDDLSTGDRSALPSDVEFVRGDAGDIKLVGDTFRRLGCDAVIHFAGSVVVPESVEDPLKYYRNNTCASRNLIEACVAAGIDKFIFSSTAAVYGQPETVPVPETAPLRPMSPYGTSKMMTELMLKDTAAAHDFRYYALRYFNVAGADPAARTGQSTPRATHLIKVACEAALGKRSHVEVFGTDFETPDGTGVRDYIHVSDLADAHVMALHKLRTGRGNMAMNCGYGAGYSVRQVIETVRKVCGRNFPVGMASRRPGDAGIIVSSPALIGEELGWRPVFNDLETIVRHALAWEEKLADKAPRGRMSA